MFTSLRSTIWKCIALMLVVAAALGTASVASAETVTTEEPVVLENGETALEVFQVTDESVVAAAGKIKCRKVHGWHGLKHPLFGYFYWKRSSRGGIRVCALPAGVEATPRPHQDSRKPAEAGSRGPPPFVG